MSDVRNYSKDFLTEFIQLYKSLPALWHIKSKEYSNRNKKNEAYRILIKKFKEVEPNATRDTVTKKINSLRSSRRKEKRKVEESLRTSASADDIYHPTLWYYDLLGFVDGQENARIALVETLDFDDDNTDAASYIGISETGSNDDDEASVEFSYRPSSPQSSGDLRSPEDEKKSSTIKALPPRRNGGGKRKRKLEYTIPTKRLSESTEEDSHDAFGRNVAHKLRNLPSIQRIFLEKIINDAIFEAELGNLNRNCYVHVPTCTSSVFKFDGKST